MKPSWTLLTAIAAVPCLAVTARAQIPLYTGRLPEGTVYLRLANALPGAATVATGFAGSVTLGKDGADRISPYFVAGQAGGKPMTLPVTSGVATAAASFTPEAGRFSTVVLHAAPGGSVAASVIRDTPDYNQVKARLTFYNATEECAEASLLDGTGRTVFRGVPAEGVAARSVNPADATVTATCGAKGAPPLPLGAMQAGGLYSVWMMRPAGALLSFVAHDTIAPPRS